jgi:hypothetical protein
MGTSRCAIFLGVLLVGHSAGAELPSGYLVWSKGTEGDSSSRKIHRMTLPGKTDVRALTSGEDVGCQISYDGKWVAYAKAKYSGGTDYHAFAQWRVHLVHVDGIGDGHAEIEVDDGYWPSWDKSGKLYYSTVDGSHTKIYSVNVGAQGEVSGKTLVLSTKSDFASYQEINECFMAPDGSWFAGRTRGNSAYTGVGAYQVSPPEWGLLGKAGSTGCMPYVAPDGKWGFCAGSTYGIRWGDAPDVPDRKEDQTLIPAKSGGSCYHPGISTDGVWVLTGHSTTSDQNAGPWELYIYKVDPTTKKTSDEQKLVSGGFNGWPHVWVTGSAPPDGGPAPAGDGGSPPASDAVPPASDAGASSSSDAMTSSGGDGGGGGLQLAGPLSGGCAVAPGRSAPPISLLAALLLLALRRARSRRVR